MEGAQYCPFSLLFPRVQKYIIHHFLSSFPSPQELFKKFQVSFPFSSLDRRLSSYPVETERYESHFPPKKKAGGEFIILLPPFPDVAARAGLPLVVGGSVHEGAEADSRRLG